MVYLVNISCFDHMATFVSFTQTVEWQTFGSNLLNFLLDKTRDECKLYFNRNIFYRAKRMKLAYIVKRLSTTQKAEKVVGITKVQGMKKKKRFLKLCVCLVIEMVSLRSKNPWRNSRKRVYEKCPYSPEHKLSVSCSLYLLACIYYLGYSLVKKNKIIIHCFYQVFLVFATISILMPGRPPGSYLF